MESFTKTIPQTSKTILFEEINPEKDSLRVILNAMEEDESFIGGTAIKEIQDKLEVKSFEEFLKKFEPVVYQSSLVSSEGKPQFIYSNEKTPGSVPVDICKQTFYEMVQNLIRQKSNGGKSNIEADYDLIEELLSPKTELKRAKQMRQDTQYCFNKALELEEKNRREEAKKYKKKCVENFKEAKKRYEKSAISLLPLAIGDLHTVIENRLALEQPKDVEIVDTEGNTPAPQNCLFIWNDNGDLEPVVKQDIQIQAVNKDNKREILFLKSWENVADNTPTISNSQYMKNTFLSCYTGNEKYLNSNESNEILCQKHNEYLSLYKDAQESFLDAIEKIIQKVLNVEMFFKHATGTDGKLPSNAGLIITNCKIKDLLGQDSLKRKFDEYISSVNSTPKEKIWFSILPPVTDDDFTDDSDDYDYDFMNINYYNSNDEDNNKGEIIKLAEVKEMAELLEKNQIISFFNFKASDKTSFSSFNEKILDSYKEKLENAKLENEYLVLAYPNFTVIPKEESRININDKVEKDGVTYVDESFLTIPTIYVDSAYVAAGITVATQNIKFLKQKGYNIIEDNPSVRFDLEGECGDKVNKFILTTQFNRETLLNRSTELNSKIMTTGFGFCFSSNERIENESGNTYVEISRNVQGKSLYKVLTKTFMYKYLLAIIGSDVTSRPKLTSTVNEISRNCKKQTVKNADKINRIFYSDIEEFVISGENPVVKFGEDEELINITFKDE